MAFISGSVGSGGKNNSQDVKIIQWMLIRAQTFWGLNLFAFRHNIQETGNLDIDTQSAIQELIAYTNTSGSYLFVNPKTQSPPEKRREFLLFQFNFKKVIEPDDDNYKFLLKCSLKPICMSLVFVSGRYQKSDFNNDPLVIKALEGKMTFDVFKKEAELKDNSLCGNSTDSSYYTIDEGIILEEEAIAILDKIGPEYFKRTGKKFNVNSGTRGSDRQAAAMYEVHMSGDKTFSLYKNRKVVEELIAIIKAGGTKESIVKKMTDLIQKYYEQGILMSPHQKAGAIDISIYGDAKAGIPPMSSLEIKIMMEIATKVTGYEALYELKPKHIHARFK